MRLLIQLTETDKRVLFALFIIVILLLVLIGYLGFLVTRVMKIQGAKLDTKVYFARHLKKVMLASAQKRSAFFLQR